MNRLDRYIFRAVATATLVTLLALLLLQFFLSLLVELEDVGKGHYHFLAALRYLLLIQPQRIYELFPMALLVGALLGMEVRLGGPRSLWPADDVVATARALAEKSGARVTITDDAHAAVAGVDFVHTDVWVSLGEAKEVWAERIEKLLPYQVNRELLAATGNPRVQFMHCLPSFHDTKTAVGREVAEKFGLPNGLEVTDDVFQSEANLAFEQAENRMHTIKALLVATLGD